MRATHLALAVVLTFQLRCEAADRAGSAAPVVTPPVVTKTQTTPNIGGGINAINTGVPNIGVPNVAPSIPNASAPAAIAPAGVGAAAVMTAVERQAIIREVVPVTPQNAAMQTSVKEPGASVAIPREGLEDGKFFAPSGADGPAASENASAAKALGSSVHELREAKPHAMAPVLNGLYDRLSKGASRGGPDAAAVPGKSMQREELVLNNVRIADNEASKGPANAPKLYQQAVNDARKEAKKDPSFQTSAEGLIFLARDHVAQRTTGALTLLANKALAAAAGQSSQPEEDVKVAMGGLTAWNKLLSSADFGGRGQDAVVVEDDVKARMTRVGAPKAPGNGVARRVTVLRSSDGAYVIGFGTAHTAPRKNFFSRLASQLVAVPVDFVKKALFRPAGMRVIEASDLTATPTLFGRARQLYEFHQGGSSSPSIPGAFAAGKFVSKTLARAFWDVLRDSVASLFGRSALSSRPAPVVVKADALKTLVDAIERRPRSTSKRLFDVRATLAGVTAKGNSIWITRAESVQVDVYSPGMTWQGGALLPAN